MQHGPQRIVLVTGSSRGIGAETARRLADPDTHVVVNHRQTADRAADVVEAIRSAGGQASTLRADITDASATAAMMREIEDRFGRLDALVLNASASHGPGAEPGDALRSNHDAQRRLAQLAVPLMPVDGRLVLVTSHQAHFFPHKAVPMGYSAVAASKRAGETALYAKRFVFSRAGIRFTVVSGDAIDFHDVDARRLPGASSTMGNFAGAIAGAVTDPRPPGIVYVGHADYLMTA